MKTIATPGYLEQVQRHGGRGGHGMAAVDVLTKAGTGAPNMVVGDPTIGKPVKEDGGATLKINAPFSFFAIRDDHPQGCDCGCDGGSIITLLLPEEY